MITKRSIIRMFLYCHNLDTIISIGNDTREDVFAELVVRTNFFRILSHANVTLVDKKRIFIGLKIGCFEMIGFFRSPNLCRENLSLFILHHSCCIRRNAFSLSTFPIDVKFIKISMMHGFGWEFNFPIPIEAYTRKFVF